MAYENIDLPASNFTGDRTNSNFYCFSGGLMRAKQRGSPYDLVASYPTDSFIGDVECVQFDGVYYWTLERQSSGVYIQKWELVSGILRNRDTFSYSSNIVTEYDSRCFCVEYYSDTLSYAAAAGASYIKLNDASDFNVGDSIVVGPSSLAAYLGDYDHVSVVNKANNTLYLSSVLTNGFSSGDAVYSTSYIYLFNKYSPYDTARGSLLKIDADDGTLYSFSSNHMFGEVLASCFYGGRIIFIKGHEVISVNPDTLGVYKHFALDNLDTDRAAVIPTYGMWVYSDVMYLLRGKYVYYDGSEWLSEDWAGRYNYVTEAFHTLLTSAVYFVEVQAEPDMIHAVDSGVPTATSDIKVTVLDQARQPLSGRSVSMSSTVGSLSPSTGTTDGDGVFTCTYNGTNEAAEVEITASVT